MEKNIRKQITIPKNEYIRFIKSGNIRSSTFPGGSWSFPMFDETRHILPSHSSRNKDELTPPGFEGKMITTEEELKRLKNE